MTEKNLIQKLSAAMLAIHPVNKDGENSYQHYSFQSEAAIKAVVKEALTDNGLMIIPQYEILKQYDRQGAKGKITHFVDVMGTFTITDGENEIVGTMAGSGQDTAEKAMVKAETTAQKYFYKQLFNISDQEKDPDCSDSNNSGNYMQTASQNSSNQRANKQQSEELRKAKTRMSALLGEIAVLTKQSTSTVKNIVVETIKKENPESEEMQPLDKFNLMINVLEQMMKKETGKNSEEIELEEV